MINLWSLMFALSAGAGLALFFYGGLHLTLRYSLPLPQAALWIWASFLLRTTLTVFGFYLIAAGNWPGVIAGLLGFIVAGKLLQLWLIRQTVRPNAADVSAEQRQHGS